MIHGAVLEEEALVGNGCVVLDGARIGARSMIAAMSLVQPGKQIPPGVLAAGRPGEVKREIAGTPAEFWVKMNPVYYPELAQRHIAGITRVESRDREPGHYSAAHDAADARGRVVRRPVRAARGALLRRPAVDRTRHLARPARHRPARRRPATCRPSQRAPEKVQRDVQRAGQAGVAAFQGGGSLFTEPVLVVNQKAKLIEINNEYAIYDQNARQIAAVREVGQSGLKKAARLLTSFDQYMTHKLQIVDMQGSPLLTLTRPAKFMKSRIIVRTRPATRSARSSSRT